MEVLENWNTCRFVHTSHLGIQIVDHVKQFEVEKEKEDEKLKKVKNKIHILVHEQEMAWRMEKNALKNMNQSSLLQFVGVPMS